MAQLKGPIGGATRIGEGFAGRGELFKKGSKVVRGPIANEDQTVPFGLNGRPGVDEASNLLAAEDSTEVTHEDKDRRSIFPKFTDGGGGAVGIEYGEVIER